MNISNSKKASVKLIGQIALVILVLAVLTAITLQGANRWRSATENCPGQCKPSCGPAEVQFSKTCKIDGDIKSDMVCCTSVFGEKDEDTEEDTDTQPVIIIPDQDDDSGDSTDTNNGEQTQFIPAKINILLGEGTQVTADRSLLVGREYSFEIKSVGTNVNSCRIRMLDTEVSEQIKDGAFAITNEGLEEGQCDKTFKITPTQEDLEKLKDPRTQISSAILTVILFNEDEEILRRETVTFRISN